MTEHEMFIALTSFCSEF